MLARWEEHSNRSSHFCAQQAQAECGKLVHRFPCWRGLPVAPRETFDEDWFVLDRQRENISERNRITRDSVQQTFFSAT